MYEIFFCEKRLWKKDLESFFQKRWFADTQFTHFFSYSFLALFLALFLFLFFLLFSCTIWIRLYKRFTIKLTFHILYIIFAHYRKDTVEIIEIFNNTTVHSLNLRQQQKVVDEMNILQRNNKKGSLHRIKTKQKIKMLLVKNAFFYNHDNNCNN